MARRRGGLFVGASEAMEILGLGPAVFRRWVARGLIPKYVDEDSGTVHYPRPQLELLAAELHTVAAPDDTKSGVITSTARQAHVAGSRTPKELPDEGLGFA